MSTAPFRCSRLQLEPSGPYWSRRGHKLVPRRSSPWLVRGGVSFSIKDAAASTVVCSRPVRGEETPWRRLLRLQGARVSRRRARGGIRAHRRVDGTISQIQRVSSAERIRSRADERSWSGVQETIPRSARQRVRLTACDLRPAARDPRVREESAERLPDPPHGPGSPPSRTA
jgi:hypothetical protein